MAAERHIDRVEAQLDGSVYSFKSEDSERQRTVSKELRLLRRKVERLQAQVAKADPEMVRGLRELHEARLLAETSRIEGIDVDMSDTLEAMRAIDRKRIIATATITEAIIAEPKVQVSVGLAEAHSIGRSLAALPDNKITLADIRNLHGLICKGEPLAGRFRRGDINIGGATHVPPHEPEMRDQIRDLVEFIESSRDANPVVSAAAAHTWLAHLHPFQDGNGRVARLLANMCLVRPASDRRVRGGVGGGVGWRAGR